MSMGKCQEHLLILFSFFSVDYICLNYELAMLHTWVHSRLWTVVYGLSLLIYCESYLFLLLIYSGRYAHFARQLTASNFGVYAMDWIGKHQFAQLLDTNIFLNMGAFLSQFCAVFGSITFSAARSGYTYLSLLRTVL